MFASVALLLSAVGIFGVLSYFVTTQRREIGVRMVLGADPGSVIRMVVGRGIGRAAVGVAVGLAASLYALRWIESQLFEVTPLDPATLGAASAALLLVALGACYLPGRRAARINPVEITQPD